MARPPHDPGWPKHYSVTQLNGCSPGLHGPRRRCPAPPGPRRLPGWRRCGTWTAPGGTRATAAAAAGCHAQLAVACNAIVSRRGFICCDLSRFGMLAWSRSCAIFVLLTCIGGNKLLLCGDAQRQRLPQCNARRHHLRMQVQACSRIMAPACCRATDAQQNPAATVPRRLARVLSQWPH